MLYRRINPNSVVRFSSINDAVVSCHKRYVCFIFFTIFIVFGVLYISIYNGIINSHFPDDEAEVVGWESNRSRKVSDYILPHVNTTIISNENICFDENPPVVILFVHSSTENFLKRSAIRDTWKLSAYEKFNIKVVFFLGLSLDTDINARIEYENNIFKDIIVENFIDTYSNLTVKTLMMLKWAQRNCNNASYILKTDDDAYININNLKQLVDGLLQYKTQNILIGKLLCTFSTKSDRKNKWYMPRYMYPYSKYPPYLSGSGYLMSMEVASRLYEESFSVPIIHVEDVYLTGLCAQRSNIRPAEHPRFKYEFLSSLKTICTIDDDYLVLYAHKVSYDEMYYIHERLASCKSARKPARNFSHFSGSQLTYYCNWLNR